MTGPTRTAEVRWVGRGSIPPAVEAWFAALGPAPAPETRTDRYLAPTDAALGVKLRPGADGAPAVEAKRREGVGDTLCAGRAEAPVEAWAKWSFPLADVAAPDDWMAVEKTRRQHHLGTPENGCALELSTLTVDGAAWWSVALEATAGTPDERDRRLRQAAARWLDRPDAPALRAADAQGYPAWLLTLAG